MNSIIAKLKELFQECRHEDRSGRRRFAIYRYLGEIYSVYCDLRSERIARLTARRIAKCRKLLCRKNAHPIRILIEASAGQEDNRTKSRWTQALKYAYGWRQQPGRLGRFFKECRGISGAAGKEAAKRAGKQARTQDGEGSLNSVASNRPCANQMPFGNFNAKQNAEGVGASPQSPAPQSTP